MPESWRASSSLMTSRSIALEHLGERRRLAARSRSSSCRRRRAWAAAPARGRRPGASGGCCRAGRRGSRGSAAGIFGEKSANTLSCVSSVVAAREVGRVAAVPAERPARRRARRPAVSTPRARSSPRCASGKSAPDDADDARAAAGDERGGERRVGRGAAEHVAVLAGGHVEIVEGDRADDEERIGAVHGEPRCQSVDVLADEPVEPRQRRRLDAVAGGHERRGERAVRPARRRIGRARRELADGAPGARRRSRA